MDDLKQRLIDTWSVPLWCSIQSSTRPLTSDAHGSKPVKVKINGNYFKHCFVLTVSIALLVLDVWVLSDCLIKFDVFHCKISQILLLVLQGVASEHENVMSNKTYTLLQLYYQTWIQDTYPRLRLRPRLEGDKTKTSDPSPRPRSRRIRRRQFINTKPKMLNDGKPRSRGVVGTGNRKSLHATCPFTIYYCTTHML